MSHYDTIFHQFNQLIPRGKFKEIVDRFHGDYKVRSFHCWAQLVALLYGQLTGQHSLRDLVTALRSCHRKLYHLGIRAISRSTLSDANGLRPAEIYEALFYHLYGLCKGRKHFRFTLPLRILDATVIPLCLSVFPWAKFRRRKGAIKLHAVLDADNQIPSFAVVTSARVHEINVARDMHILPDSIIVFDRAYLDFCWLKAIHLQGAYFVTRIKRNTQYRVLDRQKANRVSGITSDQTIRVTGAHAEVLSIELRRVRYVDRESGQAYLYLTNIHHLDALEIANIYKARWEIELFFKWIKQHLKIKSFLGTSRNAVMTQIWIALILYLLLSYLRKLHGCQCTIYTLKKRLEVNVMERRPIADLLKDVMFKPPDTNERQIKLPIIL